MVSSAHTGAPQRNGVRPRERLPVGLPVLSAVAVLSAAALGYEILLTRLFSIVQWHHFAFLVISVALLGIGLLDVGYLALPAALVQAVAASAALILLPLLAIRGERGGARRWAALAGFFCIGLAFLRTLTRITLPRAERAIPQ